MVDYGVCSAIPRLRHFVTFPRSFTCMPECCAGPHPPLLNPTTQHSVGKWLFAIMSCYQWSDWQMKAVPRRCGMQTNLSWTLLPWVLLALVRLVVGEGWGQHHFQNCRWQGDLLGLCHLSIIHWFIIIQSEALITEPTLMLMIDKFSGAGSVRPLGQEVWLLT